MASILYGNTVCASLPPDKTSSPIDNIPGATAPSTTANSLALPFPDLQRRGTGTGWEAWTLSRVCCFIVHVRPAVLHLWAVLDSCCISTGWRLLHAPVSQVVHRFCGQLGGARARRDVSSGMSCAAWRRPGEACSLAPGPEPIIGADVASATQNASVGGHQPSRHEEANIVMCELHLTESSPQSCCALVTLRYRRPR